MIEVPYRPTTLGKLNYDDIVVSSNRRWVVIQIEKEYETRGDGVVSVVRVEAKARLLGHFPSERQHVDLIGDATLRVWIQCPGLFTDRVYWQADGIYEEEDARAADAT